MTKRKDPSTAHPGTWAGLEACQRRQPDTSNSHRHCRWAVGHGHQKKSTYPNSPKSTSSGNKFTGKQGEQVVWVQQAKFLQAPQRILFETKPERPDIGQSSRERLKMPRLGTRKTSKVPITFKVSYGRDKLFDLLRSNRLLIKPLRSYTKTTYSKHWLKKYSNLIRQKNVTAPNQVWVSDITYIKTDEGYNYLALSPISFHARSLVTI